MHYVLCCTLALISVPLILCVLYFTLHISHTTQMVLDKFNKLRHKGGNNMGDLEKISSDQSFSSHFGREEGIKK